jgi:two-component system cell cycle sensor histidine kinase/response regulator CckA
VSPNWALAAYTLAVTGPTSKRIAFETARLSLARHVLADDETRYDALAHAALVSATALNMGRVGFWYFDEEQRDLSCICMYTLADKSYSSGQRLEARAFPTYVEALRERRAIVASDAREHPLTRELSDSYLAPNRIASLLDAPILFGGRVVGVVCHEHIGEPREFDQAEVDFAGSVADMVASIDEQAARLRVEAALREQEERVQRTAKLEALGRLARTSAHDFNNVLQVVMSTAGVLERHADKKVVERARAIQDAAELGARIARDLLVLGRDAPARSEKVKLDAVVAAVLPVLRARFGTGVEIRTEVSAQEPVVQADPTQIERILLNLGVNAGEASRDRGRIDIHVRDASASEVRGRGWLVLEVKDQGEGLSDEVKAHLFEPYFTTKPSGTGLGLASVYGIARQLKGRVLVDSEPGRGCTFSVLLPRAL